MNSSRCRYWAFAFLFVMVLSSAVLGDTIGASWFGAMDGAKADTLFCTAYGHVMDGQYKVAARELGTLWEKSAFEPQRVARLLGFCYVKLAMRNEAIGLLTQARKRFPNDIEFPLLLERAEKLDKSLVHCSAEDEAFLKRWQRLRRLIIDKSRGKREGLPFTYSRLVQARMHYLANETTATQELDDMWERAERAYGTIP